MRTASFRVADDRQGHAARERCGGGGGNNILGPQRLQLMDQQGVDVQALTINGYWWYAADRDLARRIVQRAERRARRSGWPRTRIASSRWRRSRCSIPIWRPSSSRTASSGSGCAARRSAATSTARICRCRSTIRSGPRRPSSACWSSCTPAAPTTSSRRARSRGRGDLGNIIGNPLETTYFLSRLIFDGTLDKFPGLQRLRRARRRLPAVLSRADRGGVRRAGQRELREQEEAERVPQVADPHRHDGVLRRGAAASGRRSGRRPDRLRHRRAVQLAGHRGPGPQRAVPERRRQGSDPRAGT